MHRGYIKFWRKSFDSGLQHDTKTFTLWVYILCHATHKPIDHHINGQKVHLEPGEMITGRKALAEKLPLTEREIRTRIKHLENYGNLTSRTTNRFTIIKVVNWSVYQQDEKQNDQQNDQQVTSKRPASDHIQECKEHKHIKKINPLGQNNHHFDRFWEAYPKKVSKQSAIRAFKKLKQPATLLPEILKAIELQKKSDKWTRENGRYIPNPATWINGGCWEDECELEQTYDDWKVLPKYQGKGPL